MQKFIMISGTCGSGKTDSILKIAAVNSHMIKNNIIWNGESVECAIVKRCENVKADMSNIQIVSPNEYKDFDFESLVCDIIKRTEVSGFILYIDDPITVRCGLDGKIHIDPDSQLSLLTSRANMVYVSVNVHRSGLNN